MLCPVGHHEIGTEIGLLLAKNTFARVRSVAVESPDVGPLRDTFTGRVCCVLWITPRVVNCCPSQFWVRTKTKDSEVVDRGRWLGRRFLLREMEHPALIVFEIF